MEKTTISVSLLNTIIQYLANRPYIEVAGIIERVQTELKPREPENGQKVDSESN